MESADFEAGQVPLPRMYTTPSPEADASCCIDSPSNSQSDTDSSSWRSDGGPECSNAWGPSTLYHSLNQGSMRTGGHDPAALNTPLYLDTYPNYSPVGLVDTRPHLDASDGLQQRPGLHTIHNDISHIASSLDRHTGKPIEKHLTPGQPGTRSPQKPPDEIGVQDTLGIYHVTSGLDLENIQRERFTGPFNVPDRSYSLSETSTVKRSANKPIDDSRTSIDPFEQDRTSRPDEDEISEPNLESTPDREAYQEMQPLPRGTGQGALDWVPNTSRVKSFAKLDQSLLAGLGTRWDEDNAPAGNDEKVQQPKVEPGPSAASTNIVVVPGDHKEQAPESPILTSAVQITDRKVEDVAPREILRSPYAGLVEKLTGLNLGANGERQGASDRKYTDAGYLMSNSLILGTEFESTPRLLYKAAGDDGRTYVPCGQEAPEGDFQSFGDQSSSANFYSYGSFEDLDNSQGYSGSYLGFFGNSVENAAAGPPTDDPPSRQSRTLDCPFRKRNPKGNNCITHGFKDAEKLKEHIRRAHNAQNCGQCYRNHSKDEVNDPIIECKDNRPGNMRSLRPYQWFQTTRSTYGGSIEDKWWQFHLIAFGVGKEECHYDPWFDPDLFRQFDPSPENRDIIRYNPHEHPIHLPHVALLTPNSQTRHRTRANSSGSSGHWGSGSSQRGPQRGQTQYTPSTSTSSPLSARGNQSGSPGMNDAVAEYIRRLEKENAEYQTGMKHLEEENASLLRCLLTAKNNVTEARDIIQQNDSSLLYQFLSTFAVEDDVRENVGIWFRTNVIPVEALLSGVLESFRSLERFDQQQNS